MKKIKKGLFAFVVLGIFYAVTLFCLIIDGTKEKPVSQPDTILILGAQVRGKTKEEAYPSKVLTERLDAALAFIKKNPDAVIIVCGGKGPDEPDSEANVMAKYLINKEVDSAKIIREDRSTRTKENIANAQKKIALGKTVIVTSDYHIYRSKLLADRLGIKHISGLPASSKTSVTSSMYAREVIALGYAVVFDW